MFRFLLNGCGCLSILYLLFMFAIGFIIVGFLFQLLGGLM